MLTSLKIIEAKPITTRLDSICSPQVLIFIKNYILDNVWVPLQETILSHVLLDIEDQLFKDVGLTREELLNEAN